MWRIKYSKQSQKDAKLISSVGLKNHAKKILDIDIISKHTGFTIEKY